MRLPLVPVLLTLLAARLPAQGLDVGILGAADPTAIADVEASIAADARVGSTTTYNVSVTTPSLATLQSHDAVVVFLTWPNGFADANLLGDNLAAFVAGGGGVVECLRSGMFGSLLGGSWATNYQLSTTTAGTSFLSTYTLGTVLQPSHPIFAGVATVSTGTGGWHSTALGASAVVIANWSDGRPMVAEHVSAPNVVYLNAQPFSTAISGEGLDPASDALLMLANCVDYVAPAPPPGPTLAASGSPGGTMTFDLTHFTASSQAAMVYGPAGVYVVPGGSCAGLQVDLLPLNFPPITSLVLLATDGAGTAQLSRSVPAAAAGLSVQAVDVATCVASNVVVL